MKFRVQQLDLPHSRTGLFERTRYLLCIRESSDDPWVCRRVDDLQLSRALGDLGLEDRRGASEVFQQARASVREFGLGEGYVEYDLEAEPARGPVRHHGRLSD